MTMVVLLAVAATAAAPIVSWEFDDAAAAAAWVPNGFLANVSCENGILHLDAVGRDPFFTVQGVAIEARPWQYVVVRVKADQPGTGELFWTGQTEGRHGGFDQRKVNAFKVAGNGEWEEIAIFPFWHAEGVIRQLRFDVYQGAHFDVDWLRVYAWGGEETPQTDVFSWSFDGDASGWRRHPASDVLFAPPVRLSVADKGWVTVRLSADRDATAAIVWAHDGGYGMHSERFALRGGPEPRLYNIELRDFPAWRDTIVAFGISLPSDPETHVRLESIALAEKPAGPADVRVVQFGFENAVNRAERVCRLAARVTNRGGSEAAGLAAILDLPEGVELAEGEAEQALPSLDFGARAELAWAVRAALPGAYTAVLRFRGGDAPAEVPASLAFAPAVAIRQADAVPAPRPVATDIELLAYYFPGWHSDTRWDPVRFVAPIRKPLLGYYDEGNPECVDWQIKWAAENGISCFLVDWYWVAGNQSLRHWFDAYRRARHRSSLEVAIMWANHNPPGTHSPEDWRNVAQEWIDHYFSLDTYYRIDGKPAVFLWAPQNIRNDLGGTEAVKRAFDESQAMAQAAGYEGITYVALGYGRSAERFQTLATEGYAGFTTYHEWGDAIELSDEPKRARYEDVAATSRLAWQRWEDVAGPLTYYPVVDTGWDSRPWHGARALAIEGRTPDLFERLLRDARAFCEAHGKSILIFAPVNEWGEGSYIEPCTEFGFDMYERIRKVFAKGDPAEWPVNVAPADVGLGPYDFPNQETRTAWTFQHGAAGWRGLMGVSDLVCEEGALRFRTVSSDPAVIVRTLGLNANQFSEVVIRMQLVGDVPEGGRGQLFWSGVGKEAEEAASVSFPLDRSGASHEYRLQLSENPLWRGDVTLLRFDPCDIEGLEVRLEEVRFEE